MPIFRADHGSELGKQQALMQSTALMQWNAQVMSASYENTKAVHQAVSKMCLRCVKVLINNY
jgi:hypothetical protein